MEFALKFVFVFEGGSILGVELVLEAASPLYVTARANDWTPGKDWQLAGFKQTVPQIQNTKTKNTKQNCKSKNIKTVNVILLAQTTGHRKDWLDSNWLN